MTQKRFFVAQVGEFWFASLERDGDDWVFVDRRLGPEDGPELMEHIANRDHPDRKQRTKGFRIGRRFLDLVAQNLEEKSQQRVKVEVKIEAVDF